MSCENARTLVPSYLDGELSEEQAAPLRGHLFDCRDCREVVKQGKVLQRWFSEARGALPAIPVPPGFASRVARRAVALAGAELPNVELQPEARSAGATPPVLVARPVELRLAPEPAPAAKPLLSFLLRLVAAAAAVLFVFALALQKQALPETSSLEAQEDLPWEVGESAAEEPSRVNVPTPTEALPGLEESAEDDPR